MKTFYDERMKQHLNTRKLILKEKGIDLEQDIPFRREYLEQALCRMFELGIIESTNREIQ